MRAVESHFVDLLTRRGFVWSVPGFSQSEFQHGCVSSERYRAVEVGFKADWAESWENLLPRGLRVETIARRCELAGYTR